MKYSTAVVSTLIIVAVLIPGRNIPDVGMGGVDKLVHICMFAVWALAVRHDFSPTHLRFLAIFIAGIFFSVLTEALQLLVEGRSFDIYDMVADAIGLIIGLAISTPALRWIKHR